MNLKVFYGILLFVVKSVLIYCKEDVVSEWDYDDAQCLEQMNRISEDLAKSEAWAFTVIDAWGKIPPGIISGNMNSMGHYDQCISTTHNLKEQNIFHGQYCLMPFEIQSITSSLTMAYKFFDIIRDSAINPNRTFPIVESLSTGETPIEYKFQLGMCIPAKCSPTYFRAILSIVLNEFNLTVSPVATDLYCTTAQSKPFTKLESFAAIFFVSILTLMMSSTIYDLYMTITKRDDKHRVLTMFSMYTNGCKLFEVKNTKSPDVITCFNGIRVLSIIWIIYGHSHMMYGRVPVYNPEYIVKWVSHYTSMLVISATVAVDSFFAISGLLVTFLTLKELDNSNGKINVFALQIHRYLRLTPVLAAVILFMTTFYKYLGSGPFWKVAVDTRVKSCERNWWAALLYIQNYLEPREMCLSETWYLSIDMQLFMMAPVLVIIIRKFDRKAIWGIISIMVTVTLYMFIISYKYEFKISPFRRDKDDGKREKMIYNATHTRMLAWLVGVILGFILHKTRDMKLHLARNQIILGWSLASITMFAITFGPYDLHQYQNEEPLAATALYEALHRTGWCISLAWIIFACHHGFGGPVNHFLSLNFWQPISRLSYCIYLIHVEVQVLRLTTLRNPIYLNEFNGVHLVWGDFGISLTIAVVWTLAFESPILVLEQIVLKSGIKFSKNNEIELKEKNDNTYDNKGLQINDKSEKINNNFEKIENKLQ